MELVWGIRSAVLLPVAILSVIWICSGCAQRPREVSVCDVVDNPGQYDGQMLLLEGPAKQTRHIGVLGSENCEGGIGLVYTATTKELQKFHGAMWSTSSPGVESITVRLIGKFEYTHPDLNRYLHVERVVSYSKQN